MCKVEEANCLVQEGARFSAKRKGSVNKKPPSPLQPKKGGSGRVQTNTVITTLIIEGSLEVTLINVARQIRYAVQFERAVTNP